MVSVLILRPSDSYDNEADRVELEEVASGYVDTTKKEFFQGLCENPDSPVFLYGTTKLEDGFIVGRKLFDKSIIEVEEA